MRTREFGIAVLMMFLGAAGCARITAQVVEKPRVDQELSGGNQGYLKGSAPAAAPRRTTRQVIQADVELATLNEMTPWPKKKPAASPAPMTSASPSASREESASVAPWRPEPREELAEPVQPQAMAPSEPASTTYTVKAGDTLDKIAVKVYGDSNQWRRIYKANQDRLKSPNRIYPGQKLVIPPAKSAATEHTASSSDLK